MKTKLIISVLLTVVLLTLSCSKDIDSQKSKTATNLSDEDLVKKVLNFIELAKDVEEGKILKSTDKMPISEAIASIDESFNYEYVFHTEPYGKIITESVEVILPIIPAEDKTYTVDAAAGYNDAVTLIRAKYQDIVSNDKKLIGIIVENKGLFNSTNIKLIITAQMGIGPPNIINTSTDWWWIRESSSCDNAFSGIGAPEILDQKVYDFWKPEPITNARIWFTRSVEFLFDDPTEHRTGDDPEDNYCDYFLFYATERLGITATEECLSGSDINTEIDFYSKSVNPMIRRIIFESILSFQNVEFNNANGFDENYPTIEHHMTVTLGDMHVTPYSEGFPINIDLP